MENYLFDKIKQGFFHVLAVLVLLYGCTTWTLRECLEQMLDRNYKNMLRTVLNKFWK